MIPKSCRLFGQRSWAKSPRIRRRAQSATDAQEELARALQTERIPLPEPRRAKACGSGKQQRLDHDGHHAGRRDRFADIDVIEVLELHAVDRRRDRPSSPSSSARIRPSVLADIAVDHQTAAAACAFLPGATAAMMARPAAARRRNRDRLAQENAIARRAAGSRSCRPRASLIAASKRRDVDRRSASMTSRPTMDDGTLCTGNTPGFGRWIVLPLTCTVNCDAPITVARMRWPGSIERSCRAAAELGAQFARASSLAMSPYSRSSWPKHIFRDAARKGERRRRRHAPQAAAVSSSDCPSDRRRDAEYVVGGDRCEPGARSPRAELASARALPDRSRRRAASATRRRRIVDARPLAPFVGGDQAGRPRQRRQRRGCAPLSISASFVVPPPISTWSRHSPRSCESLTAPEPCAASVHSSLWPAVAQTNLPASAANSSSIASAFLRLIASPGQDHGAAVDVAARHAGIAVAAAR